MHSREGLAHMLGTFMKDRRFRERVAALDRPLWFRIIKAIEHWWKYKPLPSEAKKALKEMKKRRMELRAEEAAGKRKPAGNPPSILRCLCRLRMGQRRRVRDRANFTGPRMNDRSAIAGGEPVAAKATQIDCGGNGNRGNTPRETIVVKNS